MGGGIQNNADQVVIERCAITLNSATTGLSQFGGGFYNMGEATLRFCQIASNTAQAGGGIFNSEPGTLVVDACSVANNNAVFSVGGGIASEATTAGAVSATIINSSVTANTGGGIYGDRVNATITNCTVTANTIGIDSVGGINHRSGGSTTVTNTISAQNGANQTGGITDGGNNILAGNPMIAPASENSGPTQTHALLPGSPAINAGSNAAATNAGLVTDQRGFGFNRIAGGTVDVGAFELSASRLIVTTIADEDDGTPDPATGAGTSLREAINAANANTGADLITFSDGAGGSIDFSDGASRTIVLGGSALVITDSVTIDGPGSGALEVSGNSDGDNAITTGESGVFQTTGSPDVVLSDLALSNGIAPNGAAFTNGSSGNVTFDTCAFIFNRVSGGGTGGGAIYHNGSGAMVLNDCLVANNAADTDNGAGILVGASGGNLEVNRSTFTGNVAGNGGLGGAIVGLNNSSLIALRNSTFSGNSARFGGAIRIASSSATLDVLHCTITGNIGIDGEGGISTFADSPANLRNSIIAGNTAPSAPDLSGGSFMSNGANFIGNPSGTPGVESDATFASTGTTITDLLDPALTNNGGTTLTHNLVPGSPAIDAAANAAAASLATDQRGFGFDRIFNGTADIGALELMFTPPIIVTTAVDEDDGTPDPGTGAGTSLREAIDAANANSDASIIQFSDGTGGTTDFQTAPQTILFTIGQAFITRPVDIQGHGADLLTIDGNDIFRAFELGNSATGCRIADLSMTNCRSAIGGAINNNALDLLVERCVISNCEASAFGGGIFSAATSSVTVSGCTDSRKYR